MAGGFIAGNSGGSRDIATLSWDKITGKPILVPFSAIEQGLSEHQNKIPSSAAVAGVTIDLAAGLHTATATGIANAATLANLHDQGASDTSNFNRAVRETDTASVIPIYDAENSVFTGLNDPNMGAASGFGTVAIGTSNLDKGKDLITDGTYWHDSTNAPLNAGSLFSVVMHNAAGIANADDNSRLVVIRTTTDGTALDTTAIAVLNGAIGINKHVASADTTVDAHDALVRLANGATSVHFAETDRDRPQDGNREAIFNIPEGHYGETFTIRVKYFANNEAAGNAYRDDIRIADPAVDQDGFIETGNGAFNLTIPGFEPFVGFFYWKYRASDKSIIVLYTPDHSRSDVSSFTLTLTYPVAAETTTVGEHLAFMPFTHQPASSDTLVLTMHYVSGTDWQIMATDGNGAVLEKGVYDVGAFDAGDTIYFIGDTTQYQRLSFDAAADLSIESVASLHNNALRKGWGLFAFSDKVIYALSANNFIAPDAIEGGTGQNWRTIFDAATLQIRFNADSKEYAILVDPTTQLLRMTYLDGLAINMVKGENRYVGSTEGFDEIITIDSTSARYATSKSLSKLEYLTGTNE